jgi:protein-S-isoprenylcysteine O-methyltransferase Ste14
MNVGIFISAGWAIFWLYWIISAFGAKKNIGKTFNRLSFRYVLLILAVILINKKLDTLTISTSTQSNPVISAVGLCLFVAGLLLAVWARVHLGKNWGAPMSRKQEPQLITSGPYKYIRHPIYTGVLFGLLGTALAQYYYWLIILTVAAIYFIYSATVEEKRLCEIFPDEYPAYKKRSRMLLPFVL